MNNIELPSQQNSETYWAKKTIFYKGTKIKAELYVVCILCWESREKKCNYNFTFALIFVEHVSLLFFCWLVHQKSINKIHYSASAVDFLHSIKLRSFHYCFQWKVIFSCSFVYFGSQTGFWNVNSHFSVFSGQLDVC